MTESKLKVSDYFKIASTFLFISVGILLLVRFLSQSLSFNALILSLGFILLGVIRLRSILKFFKK